MDRTVACRARKQENEVQEAATPKVSQDSSQAGKDKSHPTKCMLTGRISIINWRN